MNSALPALHYSISPPPTPPSAAFTTIPPPSSPPFKIPPRSLTTRNPKVHSPLAAKSPATISTITKPPSIPNPSFSPRAPAKPTPTRSASSAILVTSSSSQSPAILSSNFWPACRMSVSFPIPSPTPTAGSSISNPSRTPSRRAPVPSSSSTPTIQPAPTSNQKNSPASTLFARNTTSR